MSNREWTSSHGSIRLINGDARELLPSFEDHSFDAVITDPVWPNSIPEMQGHLDPFKLFAAVARHFTNLAQRAVIHLGCNSDPRFLLAVPKELPFLRACWLEYVRPSYQGRLLNGADVAYIFGTWPPAKPGAMMMPGKVLHKMADRRVEVHPCPRRLSHVLWLAHWYARGRVLDPFMGSGTTGVACAQLGLPFTGIEIEEKYFDIAVRRIEAELQATLRLRAVND